MRQPLASRWTLLSESLIEGLIRVCGWSAIFFVFAIGIPLGLLAAWFQGKWLDPFIISTLLFFSAIPVLVILPPIQWLLAVQFHILPVGGWGGLVARLNTVATKQGFAAGTYTQLWRHTGNAAENPMGIEWIGLAMGLGFVLSFGYWCTDFVVEQRAMAAESMDAARRTPLIAAFPKMILPFLVIEPGLITIALTLGDADDILAALKDYGGELRIGYSRRYKECFLRAKEQMIQGRLGKIIGGTARVYNSRAQAFNILERDKHATPVLDILTYYVDLMCWFMEGDRPVEIIARGNKEIFKGYEADDMTWAIVTFASGAIVNFGVCYALPTNYPTQGQSDRVELIGVDGCMIIDDDHLDQIIYSEKGIPGTYLAGRVVPMAFLGSNTGGEWAVGDFWGPIANETRAWLDHLVTGAPTVQTTPEQGRVNLETTIAVVRAVESGKPVRLPLET